MDGKRFLIATDGSPGGREAVRKGMELAREASAETTIVYVRHAPLPVLGDPFYGRVLSHELERGRVVMDAASADAAIAGVEFETEILEGHPPEAIVELARVRDIDLIIVGSRGRGAIAGAVLGSVSEAVVHRADRPVLVVKPRALPARRVA
jgi:nucleotide-binding universal stress UspA family protein